MTRYLSDPEHFADFINGTLFQGRQMLDAKTIIPVPQRKVEKSVSLKGEPMFLDGPLTLREMFEIPPELKPFERFLPEYRVMLVQPEMVDSENFRGDWKTIFGTLKCSENGEKMEKYIKSHFQEYGEMEEDSEELLMSMLHETDLYRKIRKEIGDSPEEEENERSAMCKAFDEIREKYRNIGYEEGIMQGRAEWRAEECKRLVALFAAMKKDGRESELSRLGEEPGFLEEMLKTYYLEETI